MHTGGVSGGMGYQMILALRDSPVWGFMLTAIGSKFPNVPGLFGGYGCPTYPLCRISNVDVFETMRSDPSQFRFSIEELMNDRPFPEGEYSTHPMFSCHRHKTDFPASCPVMPISHS